MKQRTALLVSAVLTAFVLVLIGAVVRQFYPLADVAQADAPVTGVVNEEVQSPSQAAPATTNVPEATAASAATSAPSQTYAVSPDQAGQIALAAVPNAQLLRAPELVDYNGTVAYEVALDAGNMYVDANSGQLLNDLAGPNHEEHHHRDRPEFGSDDGQQQPFGQPGQQRPNHEQEEHE